MPKNKKDVIKFVWYEFSYVKPEQMLSTSVEQYKNRYPESYDDELGFLVERHGYSNNDSVRYSIKRIVHPNWIKHRLSNNQWSKFKNGKMEFKLPVGYNNSILLGEVSEEHVDKILSKIHKNVYPYYKDIFDKHGTSWQQHYKEILGDEKVLKVSKEHAVPDIDLHMKHNYTKSLAKRIIKSYI